MTDFDEMAEKSAAIEEELLDTAAKKPKKLTDLLAMGLTTWGVGYMPLAPGTFGSLVGVLIYLLVAALEARVAGVLLEAGWRLAQITAWLGALNLLLLLLFCLLGIWACGRAVEIFRDKDPSQAVVDEVMGQLLVFVFVPFGISLYLVLAGFLLFRLFDIWKPYPIDALQNLPAGIGVCADDLLAGVYSGICLSVIYALSLGF